jgi:crotonobetainyl-CoA:carnitine CoA-transferase CaiB-like acyl-CoA transferase
LNAAFAIMAALYERERSGEGQKIDIALLDSIFPLMGWVAANLLIGGQQPVLLGNDNFTAAPSGTFRTQDGHINIAANKQEQWEDLVDILGLPELKIDPRFQERDTRKANRVQLTSLLEVKLMEKCTADWVEVLNDRGIPAGAILSLEEALNSEQARHRYVLEEVSEAGIGTIKLFNLTAKFSRTPGSIDCPPPRLSEHTAEVLAGLGYSSQDIERLKQDQVI